MYCMYCVSQRQSHGAVADASSRIAPFRHRVSHAPLVLLLFTCGGNIVAVDVVMVPLGFCVC